MKRSWRRLAGVGRPSRRSAAPPVTCRSSGWRTRCSKSPRSAATATTTIADWRKGTRGTIPSGRSASTCWSTRSHPRWKRPATVDGEVVVIAPTAFLTPELWGVGNTGPWLHDGRAGTLEEAIRLHGVDDPPPSGDPGRSEAQEARDAFANLPEEDRRSQVTFLTSLRTF